MKQLLIIGARGFGREIYNSACESIGYGTEFTIKGFLDDKKDALDVYKDYPPILSSVEDYQIEEDDVFVCALGDVGYRKKYINIILKKKGNLFSLIHKTAYISKNVVLGKGCIILANARIHCDVLIGDYVVIQPSAIIGHDVVIGDWCFINTCAICGGFCKLCEGVTIHIHSFVMPRAVIGAYAIVGAGSVTLRRVKEGQTVFGVPAIPVSTPKIINEK